MTKIELHPKELNHFVWRHLVRTLKASINIITGLHRFGLLFYALSSPLINYDKDFQNWWGLDWAFTGCFNLEKLFMNCLATFYSKDKIVELVVVSQQSPIKLWSRRMWAQTSWPSVVFIQTLKPWSNELASRRKFSTACVSFGQLYAWEDNTEVHYLRFARDFQHLATQRKLAQDDCNCKCVKLTAFWGFASHLARQFFWAPLR